MITIEVQGEQRLIAGLLELEKNWIDLRRIEGKIAGTFHGLEREQFAGADWVPLSVDYAAQKAKQYPGKGILRRTDDLFNQLTTDAGIKRVSATEIELGAGGAVGEYGNWHQLGTDKMPQRKPIDIKENQFRSFSELIENDAIAFARASGFTAIAA